MRYWIGVVSRSHVMKGVEGGFAQVCHGKKGPLSEMSKGDWFVYYSPGDKMGEKGTLQAFTAIGKIKDEDVYSFQMSPDFVPYRRDVDYKKCKQVALRILKPKLALANDKYWGHKLRRGIVEISQEDFTIIANAMGVDVEDAEAPSSSAD